MKHLFTLLLILTGLALMAQPPAGYYDAAYGLGGTALKNALHNIISNGYSQQTYSSLLNAYESTDARPNNTVWDMYSDVPGGTPPYQFNFSESCGSYNNEGDCYNREHSVPASWFDDDYPMYSDLFHVVPTDGYVNNRRSNYPFGDVSSASWTSDNGSKLGSSGTPGYSGTVFEPIDSFKGDFARIYFYMAVRYQDEMPSWTSAMFSSGNLSTWAKNMLLSWHYSDPVSAKEKQRNNAVYAIQHNRNPFVDEPGWVDAIWGPSAGFGDPEKPIEALLFPNPASDNLSISLNVAPGELVRCLISDPSGRIVLETSWNGQSNNVSTQEFAPGVYLISIQAGDESGFFRFVVL